MKKLSVLAGLAAICAAFTFVPQAVANSHYSGHSSGHYSGRGGSWHGGGHYYRGGYRGWGGGGVFIGGPGYYGGYPYYGAGYYGPDPGYYYDDDNYYAAPARAGSLSRDVQVALRNDGYYHGAIDGIVGAGTRRAIERFQADHDLPVNGAITGSLLHALGLD